jgi:hypothetical protein
LLDPTYYQSYGSASQRPKASRFQPSWLDELNSGPLSLRSYQFQREICIVAFNIEEKIYYVIDKNKEKKRIVNIFLIQTRYIFRDKRNQAVCFFISSLTSFLWWNQREDDDLSERPAIKVEKRFSKPIGANVTHFLTFLLRKMGSKFISGK